MTTPDVPRGTAVAASAHGRAPAETIDDIDAHDELSLAELVNRVLDKGAVVSGEVTISVANVDLIYLSLRLLVSSVEAMRGRHEGGGFFQ